MTMCFLAESEFSTYSKGICPEFSTEKLRNEKKENVHTLKFQVVIYRKAGILWTLPSCFWEHLFSCFFPYPLPSTRSPLMRGLQIFFLGCQSLGGHSVPRGSECLECPKEPAVKRGSSQMHLRLSQFWG